MASEPPKPSASQDIATAALGPVFAGFGFQILIAGIAINQCFNYVLSQQFKNDSRRLKALLVVIMLAFTAATSLALAGQYHYGVHQDRSADTLYSQTLDDCFATLPSGIIGALVQAYLLRRASALFKSQLVRAVFLTSGGLIIIAGFFGSVWYLAISFLQRAGKLDGRGPFFQFSVAVGMWTWASALVDLINTVTLVGLLKSKILGFNSKTDGVIRQWIQLTLVTGLPTTLIALIGAILSFSFPDGSSAANAPLAFWELYPSLYACTFISVLAGREKIRLHSETTTGGVSRPQVSASGISYNVSVPVTGLASNMLAPSLSRAPQLSRSDSNLEEGSIKAGSRV